MRTVSGRIIHPQVLTLNLSLFFSREAFPFPGDADPFAHVFGLELRIRRTNQASMSELQSDIDWHLCELIPSTGHKTSSVVIDEQINSWIVAIRIRIELNVGVWAREENPLS